MSGTDVFISYKVEDLEQTLWLKGTLESNGISCWMAPYSIPGGSNYAKEIPSAIKNCKVVVLMLSQRAQQSIWISKEINLALNERKIIMPFMLENCSLYEEFNFYLSDVQRYDAFRSKTAAVKKMVMEIQAITGRGVPQSPALEKTQPQSEAPVPPQETKPQTEAPVSPKETQPKSTEAHSETPTQTQEGVVPVCCPSCGEKEQWKKVSSLAKSAVSAAALGTASMLLPLPIIAPLGALALTSSLSKKTHPYRCGRCGFEGRY